MTESASFDAAVEAPIEEKRWQLSLRSLFIGTAIVATFIAAFSFPPLAVIAILIVEFAAFTFCLTATVYGRGWIRPFAVLTAIVMFLGYFVVASAHLMTPSAAVLALALHFIISVVSGLFGAAFHGYLMRTGGFVPIPDIPFVKDYLVNETENQE